MSAKLKLPGKPSKYRAVPVVVDGIRFASKKEARRWGELKIFEKAGKIWSLERQVRYRCEVNGTLICTYVADFRYCRVPSSHSLPASKFWASGYPAYLVVEDVKGFRTREYQMKRKLMLACYGITITEV